MPEFYDMYNDDGLDVYEGDESKAYYAVDSFLVDDDDFDSYLNGLDDELEVFEDEPEADDHENELDNERIERKHEESLDNPANDAQVSTEPEGDFVPGSDAAFVEYDADDGAEVREKNWQEDKDPSMFIDYLKDKLTKIPRHSGTTVPGCERAVAYLKDCDSQASKAMRVDYDACIDESQLDDIRKNIVQDIDRLENHIERLQKNAGAQSVRFISEGHCNACDSNSPVWYNAASESAVCMNCEVEEQSDNIQKTAGTPAVNVYMTPFERAVVGTIINSKVSGGRNIEETYEKLKNKYNFTPREELAFQQLIADHGYPVYKDRGLINEPTNPSSGDNVEWLTNYYA